MNKHCAFTICAKNYLAQAFTLKQSFIKHNPNLDFFIFLADGIDDTCPRCNEITSLNIDIIPKWKQMAFKYNVIEFNTSIKPFCINHLFNNYERVIYLDPDIYVTDSLAPIYSMLDEKDMVVTPHYNHIQVNYTGAVTEEELLFVGIYNLGFCAIKKSEIGQKIIDWWMNRLENKCFADKNNALHVDQKWIDFLPAFFPNSIYICHHAGCNVAIWNLHERELNICEGKYLVKDLVTQENFPLLFFHFSGFDPYTDEYINRRQPNFSVTNFPSFKPIIAEYKSAIYENGYELYSKLKYDFSTFANGTTILPINRRIYNKIFDKNEVFDEVEVFSFFKKKKLLSKKKNEMFVKYTGKNKSRKKTLLQKGFKFLYYILGADNYNSLLLGLIHIIDINNQEFLLGDIDAK